MVDNFILDTDSYKPSHYAQFPPGTESMMAYLSSRKGGRYDRTLMFGLQPMLRHIPRITMEMVVEARNFFREHGVPFNFEGWQRIAIENGGRLPVRIRAIPEGTIVPVGMPLMTVESIYAESFWIVSHIETYLMRLWYPITVATISWHMKQVIKSYLEKTADSLSGLPFKLHDFGSRGVSSRESAKIGGAAHLVSFMGSDTVMGVKYANDEYGSTMAGFSIPAMEHSTVTAWGREREMEAYKHMLTVYGKSGAILAMVADSYDLKAAVREIFGGSLKQAIIDSGATVVIRPDSGDPVTTPREVAEIAAARFGFTVNSKGYKMLNNVRVIQGDGITDETIPQVLAEYEKHGFSTDNLALGMGGGLLQKCDRDTQRFAYKCCSVTENGEEHDVFKDPLTDPSKASLRGRVDTVVTDDGYRRAYKAVKLQGEISNKFSAMQLAYYNGDYLADTDLEQIRHRADLNVRVEEDV